MFLEFKLLKELSSCTSSCRGVEGELGAQAAQGVEQLHLEFSFNLEFKLNLDVLAQLDTRSTAKKSTQVAAKMVPS